MGDNSRLGPFAADDSFLRRIDRKNRLTQDGIVSWQAFKPRDEEMSLSYTYQNDVLKTAEGLLRYQRDNVLSSGDLPGACRLTFYDLTEALKPPLPPRPEEDTQDTKYGLLHCVTDLPQDEIHMDKMAKLATRNGVVLPFVRRKC